MKNLITLSLLAVSLNSAAQTERGNFLIGAGLANIAVISNTGSGGIDGFAFSLHPRGAAFLSNKFAIGMQVALGYAKSGRGSAAIKTHTFGVEPFARYYAGRKNTRLFVEAGAGYYDINGLPGPGPGKISQFVYGAGPGIVHFINNNVGLEAGLMIKSVTTEGYAVYYVPAINFGFNIYLSGGKKAAENIK